MDSISDDNSRSERMQVCALIEFLYYHINSRPLNLYVTKSRISNLSFDNILYSLFCKYKQFVLKYTLRIGGLNNFTFGGLI